MVLLWFGFYFFIFTRRSENFPGHVPKLLSGDLFHKKTFFSKGFFLKTAEIAGFFAETCVVISQLLVS